jgi:hypothetical protein
MSERELSQRELNRALLARQLLLERSSIDLAAAVEQVAGLQTQYAPSAYIGLWSRLRNFRRDALTEALVDRRVVQATLMRATIHVVSARDFPLLAAAIRRARRDWWVRVQSRALAGVDLDELGSRVRAHLADGALRQTELMGRLEHDGFPNAAANGMGIVIDLVRVPPSGTWDRRRADLYGLAETWLAPSEVSEEAGVEHAVRRYLGGFGPAALADIASWSGLPVTLLRPVLERIELRRLRGADGKALLDVPDGPLPDPDTPAPVRFLPTWDATLLVHARRTQILPERFRPRIFSTRTPHSFPTFLVDGAVAGTWRYDDGRIDLEPFEPLPARTMDELHEEAERLARFHAQGE